MRGKAIHVNNTLRISKLNWLAKTESLALRITDSERKFWDVIYKYRSLNFSKEDNYKLQKQLN